MKILPLLCALALCSCASQGDSKKTPPLMSQRMASRLTKPNMNKRSVYDKSMQASFREKDSAARFGRQKYNAKPFADSKSYTNTPNYKTAAFSRADQKNTMGRETFAESNKTPKDADASFTTNESQFSRMTDAQASKTFRQSSDTFATSANRDALKSINKNDRPEMIELEENRKNPAYSEEQVRRLMGRD